jgi:predicted nucleic acid-binding protein
MTFVHGPQVVVVDASVAVPILRGDSRWLERWAGWIDSNSILLAPPHFSTEVANALLRSARLPAVEVWNHVARLWAVGIEIADRGRLGLLASIDLAERRALSVYDAAYLELAIDVDGQLATADRQLRAAAVAEGIEVAEGSAEPPS